MFVRAMHNAIREKGKRYQPGEIFELKDERRAQKMLQTTPPMVKEPTPADWQDYADALKKNGEDIPEFVQDVLDKREALSRKAAKAAKGGKGSGEGGGEGRNWLGRKRDKGEGDPPPSEKEGEDLD